MLKSSSKIERILGIDPGFGRVGFGVIEKQGTTWVHVAHGLARSAGACLSRSGSWLEVWTKLRKKSGPGRRAAVRAMGGLSGRRRPAVSAGNEGVMHFLHDLMHSMRPP